MEYVLLMLFLIYLMPWVLAEAIEHPRSGWILALVLGLGWTVVGWLVALGWVVRDWPRPHRPPKLVLVDPDAPPPDPRRWLRRGGLTALGLIVLFASVWWWLPERGRTPARGEVRLAEASAEVRMGPSTEWPVLGELRSPCRLALVEREGAWRRVWRLEDCDGAMRGRSGWVRVEALR